MLIFLYGSLLDTRVLERRAGTPGLARRAMPARLAGFRRVRIRGGRWPTLRRAPGHVLEGMVLRAGAAALRCLAAYEGPRYRLVPVAVGTPLGKSRVGKVRAWAWVAPGTYVVWGEGR